MSAQSKVRLVLALALACVDRAGSAERGAGPPTSPDLGDPTTRVLYRVAWVVDSGNIATSFHCTNLGATNALVKVVLRNAAGTPVCNITDTGVGPGVTSTLSTSSTALFTDDFLCVPALGVGVFGSALITVDTLFSMDVACTAHVLDGSANPPAFIEKLDLFLNDGQQVSELLFADAFESGNAFRWSLRFPP
jgi:hypothetical protein